MHAVVLGGVMVSNGVKKLAVLRAPLKAVENFLRPLSPVWWAVLFLVALLEPLGDRLVGHLEGMADVALFVVVLLCLMYARIQASRVASFRDALEESLEAAQLDAERLRAQLRHGYDTVGRFDPGDDDLWAG